MNQRIRVGAVPYLNSRPLIHGYRSVEDAADFVFAAPSDLSGMMARSELDVSLGSSVGYLGGGVKVLPGVGIISRGPVNSVLLTGGKPAEFAETVNLDPSSLTSCTLAALWYRECLGRTPRFSRFPIDSEEAGRCDAQLAIGDAALRRNGMAECQVDLGAAWEEWVGHPFVYAVWLVRSDVELGEVGRFLATAPARNGQRLLALAEEASADLGLDRNTCVEYLTNALQFSLDGEALQGLDLFLNMAARHHEWLCEVIEGFPPLGVSLPVEVAFSDLRFERFCTGSQSCV
jgi:chorismate dehydratase